MAMVLEGMPRDDAPVGVAIFNVSCRVSYPEDLREEVGVQVKFPVHDFPLVRIDIHDVPMRYRIGAVSAVLGRVLGPLTYKGRTMFGRSELPCGALPLIGIICHPLDRLAVSEVGHHVVALHGESILFIQLGDRGAGGDLVWGGGAD